MNPIQQAIAQSDKSYRLAKAAIANAKPSDVLTPVTSGGIFSHRSDLSKASEQLKHFTGWVYSSIRPIAQRIAGQPIHVGKRKGKRKLGIKSYEDVKPLDSHELLELLADPNDLMVAWSLIYVTIVSLELTGRQLWWITEVEGRKQILPIPTSWILGFEGTTSITSFRIRPPNAAEEFNIPSDECCYFAYPNPGDLHGAWSPLQAVAGAVDSDEAIESSRITAFKQGIHSTHAIRLGRNPHPDMQGGLRPRLTTTQQEQIVSAVKRRYQGLGKNEPVILDGMIEEITRLSNTPDEMDWLSSEKSTKSRIMQGFGVNPIITGEIEGANRASSLAAEDHFTHYTINPKIQLLSETLTEWLGKIFGDVVVWIEPCTVRDDEMKVRWVELLTQQGAISNAELRSLAPLNLEGEATIAKRNPLLSTVGGMTGSIQILAAVGGGSVAPDTAARLLALFFEIDEAEARRIVGTPSPKLAADYGVASANELRQAVGLPIDNELIGHLARGRDSQILGPIESSIQDLVTDAMGSNQADDILEQLRNGRNGHQHAGDG